MNRICLFCQGAVGTPFPTQGHVACLKCVHRIVDFWAIGFLPGGVTDHYLLVHGMPRRQEFLPLEGA